MDIILSIPHSSTHIPTELKDRYALSEEHMNHHLDYGVDTIMAPFSYKKIEGKASRFVVDVNRARDEFTDGQGVIIVKDWDGNTVFKEPLSEEEREALLTEYYDPFYSELIDALSPDSLLVDCHSMDSKGNLGGGDVGNQRPQICICTGNGQSCSREIAMCFIEGFSRNGFETKENDPYSGSRANILRTAYERGIPAIAVEFNKSVYMDEQSLVLDEEAIERLRRALTEIFSLLDQ